MCMYAIESYEPASVWMVLMIDKMICLLVENGGRNRKKKENELAFLESQ